MCAIWSYFQSHYLRMNGNSVGWEKKKSVKRKVFLLSLSCAVLICEVRRLSFRCGLNVNVSLRLMCLRLSVPRKWGCFGKIPLQPCLLHATEQILRSLPARYLVTETRVIAHILQMEKLGLRKVIPLVKGTLGFSGGAAWQNPSSSSYFFFFP